MQVNTSELAVDDSDTLYEAIFNDRRLTTRNIVRWIDQILNTLLVFHKSYTTVGDFGINDIKLGPDPSLASAKGFTDHLLTKLKSGHDALSALNFSDSAKKKKETQPSDRSVCVDFYRKLSSVKKLHDEQSSAPRVGSPEKRRRRLPKGFDCPTITQFDAKNDNNLSIPKDHRLHNSIAELYHEYVHNVCTDFRCLAIVILQIYTLSVFSDDERSKLMYFKPPQEASAVESEDERVEKKSRATAPAAAADHTGNKNATRRTSTAGANHSNALVPPAPGRSGSPAKGKGKAIANTVSAPAPESGAVEPKKRKHRANVRTALELALLPSYPCIERMPSAVKDLLLNVCFKRPSDVLEEEVTKVRGELSTRFEFVLLKYAKDCKDALRELVLQSQENAHHEPPEIWTPADERARIAAQRERQAKYALLAEQGPRNAQARLKHEKYLLWYSMQSDQYKGKLEQRLKARRKAEKNIFMRRKYIYQASFHRWSMVNFTAWIQEALLDYCHMLQELRLAAQQEKKRHDKNPAVYVTRLINDLLSVFTKTTVAKLTAFRDKRAEQDSVGWENAITFVKPQTSLSRKRPRGMSSKSGKFVGGTSAKSIIPSLESIRLQDGGNESNENSLCGSRFGGSFADDEGSVDSWQSDTSSSHLIPASQHLSQKHQQHQQQQKKATLPNIVKPKMTAAQSRNQKKKEETFVPKPLTPDEVLMQCFDIVAAHLARIITHNHSHAFDLTRNMRDTVKKQEKDSEAAEAQRILITSEEQLYFKRLAAQAVHFTSFVRHMRSSVVEFCDLIELVDRGWVKFMVHLASCSIMHHYNRNERNRTKGENYATDRLIAFFRGIVVRNIVKRVWQRAYQLHPFIPSPISSRAPSMRGSPNFTLSPSASFRKHMMPPPGDVLGLGVRSTDTHDSGNSRGHSQKEKKHVRHIAPTPEAAQPQHRASAVPAQYRKPFFIKDLQTPSAVSAHVDFSVSLDCGDQPVPAKMKHKHLERMTERFNMWKNIVCMAYIDTEIPKVEPQEPQGSQEPQELKENATAAKSLVGSGLFASGALPVTSSHNKVHIHPVEQPVNRKLVIRLVNSKDKDAGDFPCAENVKRVAVRAELVLLTGNVHEHDLESIASDGLLSKSTYKSVVGMSYKHSSIVAQENRQIAALALWTDPTTAASGTTTASQSSNHTPDPYVPPSVVHYRVELDDLRSYSCYAVQLVVDKTLAEDLKEGNKAYFHSLRQMEDDDNHSLGSSSESLDELDFAEVGKPWSIHECGRPAPPDQNHFTPLSASPPSSHGLQVQLTHYVTTRPGIPRTVKALTAKVTYHSTDLTKSLSGGDTAEAPSLVQFLPHTTAGEALTGGLHPSADSSTHVPACVSAMQSGIELHWTQSEDDLHTHTHYEVQRRLLLMNTVAPVKLQLPPARQKVSSADRRANRRNRRDEPPASVPADSDNSPPFEETVYVGPWRHAAGLNSALKDKARGLPSAQNRLSQSTQNKHGEVFFPHHSTFCTDRVALPAELDGNPDAYNAVMGYLCATFPDLVLRAAGSTAPVHVINDVEITHDQGKEGDLPASVLNIDQHRLLDAIVESGLSVGYEYRVRAINSVGTGKFNATTSYIPLNHPSKTGQGKAHRVCTVQVAQVCTHLVQLCDFRTNHPKYRSHNTQLVHSVLVEHVERTQQQGEAKVRSGDPFVEHIVALKNKATESTGNEDKESIPETSGVDDGKSAEDSLADWLLSLQNECPL